MIRRYDIPESAYDKIYNFFDKIISFNGSFVIFNINKNAKLVMENNSYDISHNKEGIINNKIVKSFSEIDEDILKNVVNKQNIVYTPKISFIEVVNNKRKSGEVFNLVMHMEDFFGYSNNHAQYANSFMLFITKRMPEFRKMINMIFPSRILQYQRDIEIFHIIGKVVMHKMGICEKLYNFLFQNYHEHITSKIAFQLEKINKYYEALQEVFNPFNQNMYCMTRLPKSIYETFLFILINKIYSGEIDNIVKLIERYSEQQSRYFLYEPYLIGGNINYICHYIANAEDVHPFYSHSYSIDLYNKYQKIIEKYLDSNNSLFSSVSENMLEFKINFGLIFEDEKYLEINLRHIFEEFYNKLSESKKQIVKNFEDYLRYKTIPSYVYKSKYGVYLLISLFTLHKWDNLNNEKIIPFDFLLKYQKHFEYLLNIIVPNLLDKKIITSDIFLKSFIVNVVHFINIGMTMKDLKKIVENAEYTYHFHKSENILWNKDKIHEYIIGKHWLELEKSCPFLYNRIMNEKTNIRNKMLLGVFRGEKLDSISEIAIPDKGLPNWIKKLTFKRSIFTYDKKHLSLYNFEEIYDLTNPKVVGGMLISQKHINALEIYLFSMLQKALPILKARYEYERYKKEWNEIIGWLCKNRKEIWIHMRNSQNKIEDFFDYILAQDDLLRNLNVRKFNTKMSFVNAYNANVLFHEIIQIRKNDSSKASKDKIFPKLPITIYNINNFLFEQLLSPYELVEEGNEMHHCVGGYASAAKNGISFIIKVSGPIKTNRATLEVRFRNGKYVIAQKKTFCNKAVHKKTLKNIDIYLEELNKKIIEN